MSQKKKHFGKHRPGCWTPVEGESEAEATLGSGHFDFDGTNVFDGTIRPNKQGHRMASILVIPISQCGQFGIDWHCGLNQAAACVQ